MTEQYTITTYNINEHPDKEAAYQYIRDNWHDLGQHYLDESIESLKAFSDYFNADLDYAISVVPDRGEFITCNIADENISKLSGNRLRTYLVNNFSKISTCCPFTGCCYDETLLDQLRAFIKAPDGRDFQELLSDATSDLLKDLHSEGEYIYSDEGIHELLESNEYDLLIDGSIH